MFPHPAGIDQGDQVPEIAGAVIDRTLHSAFARPLQDVCEAGNPLPFPGGTEPAAGIQGVQVPGQPFPDGTGSVGGPVQEGIVQEVEDAVLAQDDVAFHDVDAPADAGVEGGEGVFRSDEVRTAVTADLGKRIFLAGGKTGC